MSIPPAASITVTEYLSADHRRLDALLAEAVGLAAATATLEEGASLFAAFRRGLERHIVVEEEILFPAFERASGMASGGPTAVMRVEHGGIRTLLAKIEVEFTARRGNDVSALAAELADILGGHNQKEEQVLYPYCDQLASEDGRAALLRGMSAVLE